MLDGFFPGRLVVSVKLELLVIVDNNCPIVFPEVRIPSGQNLGRSATDLKFLDVSLCATEEISI